MITFTYVTVCYNAAAVIGRTLDSVRRQDYPAIEHLIIDGASTDETLALVTAYSAQTDSDGTAHRVLVTSEPDHGIYDAMNKGLRSATGDYICFLNAGDTLPTDNTVSAIAAAIGHPSSAIPYPAVLYGNTDIVDANGQFVRHRRLQPPEHLTWRSFRQGMVVCHQAFYARTDFAIQNTFNTAYRLSADVDWCIRVMRQADREQVPMLNLHRVVANYLEQGATTTHHRASLMERYHIMAKHYGHLTTIVMHGWFVVRALFRQ